VWDQLADAFSQVDSVKIVRFDTTSEDCPAELKVRVYPTLRFFPSLDRPNYVDYKGSKTLNDLVEFVMKTSSKKPDEYMEVRGIRPASAPDAIQYDPVKPPVARQSLKVLHPDQRHDEL
jgi:hypothetical protein